MSSGFLQYLPVGVLILVVLSLRLGKGSIRNFAIALVGAATGWFASSGSLWGVVIWVSLAALAFALSPLMSPSTRALGRIFDRLKEKKVRKEDMKEEGVANKELIDQEEEPENPAAMITFNNPDDAVVDIVAVHGLASSVETTWMHPRSKAHWLKEFLTRPGQLEMFTARIMAFRHNSEWATSAPVKDLPDYGMQLLSALRDERRTDKTRQRPLILIGHSFGGLLIKQALLLAKPGLTADKHLAQQNKFLEGSLAGIIFLGTPHGGSSYAWPARLYCAFHYWDNASITLLRYMDPGSRRARKLEDDFSNAYNEVSTMDYFESKAIKGVAGVVLNLVVPKDWAARPGRPSQCLDTDHFGLNKYENLNDDRYITVKNKIISLTETKIRTDTEEAAKNGPSSKTVLDWLLGDELRPRYPREVCKDLLASLHIPIGQKSLTKEDVTDWRGGKRKWLWCHGMPGAGKTSLATIIIDYLLGTRSKQKINIGVACIYCIYSDKTQSALNFVKSIVHQLAEQSKELPKELMSLYQTHTTASPPTSPTIEDYELLLKAEICKFDNVYLVVDALDECRTDDAVVFRPHSDTRSRLLRTLNYLGTDVHLLVTSRDEELKATDPQPAVPFAKMIVSATSEDIGLYAEGRVDSTPCLSKLVKHYPELNLKSKIKETITAKAASIFLPAQLYMSLLAKNAKDLEPRSFLQTLENLPSFFNKTLGEAYHKAYADILKDTLQDRDDADRARQVLSWVIFTQDTSNLTMDMMRRIISLETKIEQGGSDTGDSDDESGVESDSYDDSPADSALEENILSACRGLVTLDRQSRTLRLVHSTANDYFSSQTIRDHDFPSAQKRMAKICLACLLSPNLKSRGQVGLWRYAGRYWGHHAKPHEEFIRTQILALLNDKEKMRRSFHMVSKSIPQTWGRAHHYVEPLHVSAYFGLESTARHLLANSANIEAMDSAGWTALRWAMIGAPDQAEPDPLVALLLEKKADLLSKDKQGVCTVHWAVGFRPLGTIMTSINITGDGNLVSVGEISTVKSGQSFATAYQSPTVAKTRPNVIKLMITKLPDVHVDVESGLGDGQTLLSVVAGNWQWGAVDSLIKRGADVNHKDNIGMTPLLHALQGPRHTWTIEDVMVGGNSRLSIGDITTIDPSVKINISDSHYSEKNIENHICQLIDDYTDLEARDMTGRTALSLAAENRFSLVAEKLLRREKNKADPNTIDDAAMTPLHWACSLPRFETVIIRHLICLGDARIRLGTTKLSQLPLHELKRSRLKGIHAERTVNLLLHHGVNVAAKDNHGFTALALATADDLETHCRMLRQFLPGGAKPAGSEVYWAPQEMQRRDLERILVALLDHRGRFLLNQVAVRDSSWLFLHSTSKITDLSAQQESRIVISDRPHIVELSAADDSCIIIGATAATSGRTSNSGNVGENTGARSVHIMGHDLRESSSSLQGDDIESQAVILRVRMTNNAQLIVGAKARIEDMMIGDSSRVYTKGRSVISRIAATENAYLTLGGDTTIEEVIMNNSSRVRTYSSVRISKLILKDASSLLIDGATRIKEIIMVDSSRVHIDGSCTISKLLVKDVSFLLVDGAASIDEIIMENPSLVQIRGSATISKIGIINSLLPAAVAASSWVSPPIDIEPVPPLMLEEERDRFEPGDSEYEMDIECDKLLSEVKDDDWSWAADMTRAPPNGEQVHRLNKRFSRLT
ncbi:hypothetical protein KAF25_002520 [Fusarium avenaceum]|uniref:Nephrocystin 3-like N-terminal domain-containing protein n=1 Tax=Fusarium avenaceum TaxID=40199 RepID=A0A9P7H9I8_9HYPO|nr:hypothetical protein KAF25_002520 [Fusarium avenaceum]